MKVLIPPSEGHHGAAAHSRQLATLVARAGVEVVAQGHADVAHAQFSDALWGADIDRAAGAYERWAASLAMPAVLTLHDVPGADADRSRDARRGLGYARAIAASDEIIVSSRHEAVKVARLCGRRPQFIELPIPQFEAAPSSDNAQFDWAEGLTIGILGFLYPGKGHREAIDAAARQMPAATVVSLGAVSPGHQRLHADLQRYASRRGVRFEVTGALSEARLASAAAAIKLPMSPNRAVSASASMMAWLGCRRRPLCALGDYSAEVADRHPGQIHLYDHPDDLDTAVRAARVRPEHTWLDQVAPWPDVGAQHVAVYSKVLRNAKVAGA